MGLLECSTRKWRRWRPGEAVFNPLCGGVHCDPFAGITAALDSNSRPIELRGRGKKGGQGGGTRGIESLRSTLSNDESRAFLIGMLPISRGAERRWRRSHRSLARIRCIKRDTRHASRPANYSRREYEPDRRSPPSKLLAVAARRDFYKNGIFIVK